MASCYIYLAVLQLLCLLCDLRPNAVISLEHLPSKQGMQSRRLSAYLAQIQAGEDLCQAASLSSISCGHVLQEMTLVECAYRDAQKL